MADGDMDEAVVAGFDLRPDWPGEVTNAIRTLFSFDVNEVEGQARLGSLVFSNAPVVLERIREIVRDIAQEPWDQLPATLTTQNGLQSNLQSLNAVLEQMVSLSAATDNAPSQKASLEQQLTSHDEFFRTNVRPYALTARVDRAVEDKLRTPGAPSLEDELELLRELQQRSADLRNELDSRADLVQSLRQRAGESAGADLADTFSTRADSVEEIAEKWLIALVAAVVVAVGAAVGTFLLLAPERGSNDPRDFAALGLGVFILGLLAFGIRVCAQNYRVNRHLQAVAESRAAAVATFTRLTSSVNEPEIRSALALALAQAVFATEDTGLVDSSGDQVTLIERIAPRVSSTTS